MCGTFVLTPSIHPSWTDVLLRRKPKLLQCGANARQALALYVRAFSATVTDGFFSPLLHFCLRSGTFVMVEHASLTSTTLAPVFVSRLPSSLLRLDLSVFSRFLRVPRASPVLFGYSIIRFSPYHDIRTSCLVRVNGRTRNYLKHAGQEHAF